MFKAVKLLTISTLLVTNFSKSMDQQPIITPYDPARDYPAVKAILEASPKDMMYPGQPLEYTAKYLTSEKYKTDVLRIGDATVGFVNYCVFDMRIFWCYTWDRVSALHLLGVEKEHRRKGYAKLLAEHAMEYCKNDGASYIFLQTTPDNEGARKLYERLGFVARFGALFKRNFK